MSIQEYFEKKKELQEKLIKFLDNQNDEEENYSNLINLIQDQQLHTDKHEMKIFLYIINQISNHHHRHFHFIEKIEKIIKTFQDQIQREFTKYELFQIFKLNKRILLYLILEKIITIDENIYLELTTICTYSEYFQPEIDEYKGITETKYPLDFNKKRLKGENEDIICQFIQNDLIEEFITYVHKNNYLLNNFIPKSIFETNPFLLDQNEITLIEYASFYGANQIFKYLYKNNVKLTKSLWMYGIHGESEEIIRILEEKKIDLNYKEEEDSNDSEFDVFISYSNKNTIEYSYILCLIESIKCHNNDVFRYIEQNFLSENEEDLSLFGFRFYNFFYINDKFSNNQIFAYSCRYDYYTIVKILLQTKKIDINSNYI